jgi:sialic acid synthase SpsE
MTCGFQVGQHRVGGDAPLLVVAEIGLNHDGDAGRALALADAAAGAGASAVKLQSLRGDRLVAADCPAPMHVHAGSLREFFAGFELDVAAHRAVADTARARGLAFVSTPLDEEAVAMLVSLDVDALKIASGDITHHRLIATAAASGRPLIISTGMSSLDEVAAAVACAREAGATDLALLHCVSCYPTPPHAANLRAISTLAREFRLPVGLSDHGTDPLAPALAVSLGASIYERHLVSHAADTAIDRAVSSTPAELADVVALARRARTLLGEGTRRCGPEEAGNVVASRRALHAVRDLPRGHRLAAGDLAALRPCRGVGAERWREVIGRTLQADLAAGDPLTSSHLDPEPAREGRPS